MIEIPEMTIFSVGYIRLHLLQGKTLVWFQINSIGTCVDVHIYLHGFCTQIEVLNIYGLSFYKISRV